ncbi:hypothetical protein E2C01_031747 [Portunus trituberculatus]|uniref:Uncharacterized protein n=1 Tax=Portunus trituberculatus TaxID=210409 RepID=A0A5B7EUA1_PORTR|nr:hypothetical protein [Portunus trituberculatus]
MYKFDPALRDPGVVVVVVVVPQPSGLARPGASAAGHILPGLVWHGLLLCISLSHHRAAKF